MLYLFKVLFLLILLLVCVAFLGLAVQSDNVFAIIGAVFGTGITSHWFLGVLYE